ncbi:helix-turn-helix domain-containing protein [Schumannella luteola]
MTDALRGERAPDATLVLSPGDAGAPRVHGIGSVRLAVGEGWPREFSTGDWRAIVVRVPEAMIPAAPADLRRVAARGNLLALPGVAAPLVDRARAMVDDAEVVPPFSDEVWWARAVSDVVTRVTGIPPAPSVVARARRAQVERIVARYSGDRRLSPETIAAAIGVSRRSLYELAEPQFGGISEYIRTARTMRAMRMLADETLRDRSSAEIASAAGFSSAKHMTRALLAHNGISPASLRPDSATGLATA